MKQYLCIVLIVSIILFVFLIPFEINAEVSQIQKANMIDSYGKIPLAFTANKGQLDSQVKFTTRGSGCQMFFTKEGTTFLLSRETEESIAKRTAAKIGGINEDDPLADKEPNIEKEYFALKKVFVNANYDPEVVGEERLSWNNNYFIGNKPSEWRTDVPNYGKVRLRNLYDGIDLVYYGNKNGIKYDFIVKPGADPSQILLTYDIGNDSEDATLLINDEGELVISTPLGEVIEQKPCCYQSIDGEEIEVDIRYEIIDNDMNNFTFCIGDYNTNLQLIIDP